MTIREHYETMSTVLVEVDGDPRLWIEPHPHGLTVVDNLASASELGYRDESGEDVDGIVATWKLAVEWTD